MTARDALGLEWIAHQYAVSPDVLAVLLARLSDPEDRIERAGQRRQQADPERVSPSMVRYMAGRWERAGWAERRSIIGRSWIIPTAKGYREVGIEPRRTVDTPAGALVMEPWAPRARMLPHVHAVAVLRLALEPALGPGQRWISERVLRRELRDTHRDSGNARDFRHAFDGAIEGAEGERIGLDVELTLKSPAAFEDHALAEWPPEFTELHYYAPGPLVPILRARLDRMAAKGLAIHPRSAQALPDLSRLGITYMEG